MEKLDEIGIIQRTEILSRHGRGRTFQLSIKHNDKTKRLIEAIGKAAPMKSKHKQRQ